MRVWRQKNERFSDCLVVNHDECDGCSVLVEACISDDGSIDLCVIRNESLTGL